MKILSALPNLIKIDIDLPSAVALATFTPVPAIRIQDDIVARGSRLQRLSLTADSYESNMPTSQLCSILQELPKLEMLELSGVDRQFSDGPQLRDVIAGMQHLQYLELCEAQCVTDDWADVEWKGGLKSLSLDEYVSLSTHYPHNDSLRMPAAAKTSPLMPSRDG
jgi:hypothetical protein